MDSFTLSNAPGRDLALLQEAARLADSSAGMTQPHPNAACLLVGPDGAIPLASAYQRAQGTTSAEVQAVLAAQGAAKGSTAYLNLEAGGDCHGEPAAIKALIQGGVSRVVVGMKHPLAHFRGTAIRGLKEAGIRVGE